MERRVGGFQDQDGGDDFQEAGERSVVEWQVGHDDKAVVNVRVLVLVELL